jgi:hypothetical protein
MDGLSHFSSTGTCSMLVWKIIFFFRTLFVQVAATAPQTTGRLLAVFPNMAKLLAVIALCKPILSFIVFYPDCNVAKAWQSENFLGS